MRIEGHKLYFRNGQFLNLHIFEERILLPFSLISGVAAIYGVFYFAPKLWLMFH